MSISATSLSRISNLLVSNNSTNNIDRVQQQLMDIQNQLSTGKRINEPSDDPVASATAQQLQKTLEQRQGYLQNLQTNQSQLGQVDSSLSNLTDLLNQAQSIASKDASSTTDPTVRASDATVLQTIYQSVLQIANQQFNGTYLFGGDSGKAPYAEALGGVQFVGSSTVLNNSIDNNLTVAIGVSGASIFGATSAPTGTANDLSPNPPGPLTNETPLANLMNGTGLDVSGGLQISNGPANVTVDFTGCTTVGDVLRKINSAGAGVNAQINAAGNGIEIVNATQGATLTVSENTGTLGATLGVLTASPAQASGIFGALLSLQKALQNNDTAGITAASTDLQTQSNTVIRVRGQAGAMVQQMQNQQSTLQDQNTATQSLLSQLTDTDMTSAVSQYQLLQNTLQASLQTTAQVMNMSLMDFLQ